MNGRNVAPTAVAVALLAVQLVVAAVSCEALYRVYLKWFAPPPVTHAPESKTLPEIVHVYWPGPFTYRPYGFDYGPPDRRFVVAGLRRDFQEKAGYRVTHVTSAEYPQYGNFPPVYSDHRNNGAYVDVDYDKADVRILAFGDSYTSASWPDLAQYRLEKITGLRVRVINFGREFTGVQQAIDTAAYYVPQLKPDFF